MPRGRDRVIEDERILLEFILTDSPALFTSEIAENVSLTRQRLGDRLKELEELGYVKSKKASGRRLWWITDEGSMEIANKLRQLFDSHGDSETHQT